MELTYLYNLKRLEFQIDDSKQVALSAIEPGLNRNGTAISVDVLSSSQFAAAHAQTYSLLGFVGALLNDMDVQPSRSAMEAIEMFNRNMDSFRTISPLPDAVDLRNTRFAEIADTMASGRDKRDLEP